MPGSAYQRIYGDINPLPDDIIVVNMEKGDRVRKSGFIIKDDNGKLWGTRPRWAQVYKTGSKIDYVQPGDWVLIEHGRWTYGIEMVIPEGNPDEIFYVQKIDPTGLLIAADEPIFQ